LTIFSISLAAAFIDLDQLPSLPERPMLVGSVDLRALPTLSLVHACSLAGRATARIDLHHGAISKNQIVSPEQF
jgi:hypothetical protein